MKERIVFFMPSNIGKYWLRSKNKLLGEKVSWEYKIPKSAEDMCVYFIWTFQKNIGDDLCLILKKKKKGQWFFFAGQYFYIIFYILFLYSLKLYNPNPLEKSFFPP